MIDKIDYRKYYKVVSCDQLYQRFIGKTLKIFHPKINLNNKGVYELFIYNGDLELGIPWYMQSSSTAPINNHVKYFSSEAEMLEWLEDIQIVLEPDMEYAYKEINEAITKIKNIQNIYSIENEYINERLMK